MTLNPTSMMKIKQATCILAFTVGSTLVACELGAVPTSEAGHAPWARVPGFWVPAVKAVA